MKQTCFVLMPFDKAFDGVWQSVIRNTVESAGDACIRADDVFRPGVVVHDILEKIRACDYLIADLTARNPNVFYELGFAHAIGKNVIMICQRLDDVPFDVRHHRLISYEDSIAGARALRISLAQFIHELPS